MHVYLPILGISLEEDRTLSLADLAGIIVLDVLYILGSLDAVILGEGTRMALLFDFIAS